MAVSPKQVTPLRMGKQGRIVVPADIRSELGFDEGVRLVARVIDGELRILTYQANLERIRDRVRARAGAAAGTNSNVVDELIAERRAEAIREEAKEDER